MPKKANEEEVFQDLEDDTTSRDVKGAGTAESEKGSESKKTFWRELGFLIWLIGVIYFSIFIFTCSDEGWFAIVCVDNWAAIISISILELILLMVIGRILDIKDIETLVSNILNSLARNNSEGKG